MSANSFPKYPGYNEPSTARVLSTNSELNNPRYKQVAAPQPSLTFDDIDSIDAISHIESSALPYCSFCNGSGVPCSFCGAFMDLNKEPAQQRVKINDLYENKPSEKIIRAENIVENNIVLMEDGAPCKKTFQILQDKLPNTIKQSSSHLLDLKFPLRPNIKECRSAAVATGGKVVQIVTSPSEILNPNVDVVIITNPVSSTYQLPLLDGKDLLSLGSGIIDVKDVVIKNYSLASHTLKTHDANKIDKIMTTIKLEPGAKKQLLATGSNWINI